MNAQRKRKAPGTPKQIEAAKTRNDERDAALAERNADLANAWREDPEFGNALNLAVVVGDIGPLKQYLCSEKPLTRMNRRMLASYIDLLAEHIASHMRRRGRPRRCSDIIEHPSERAARCAALALAVQKTQRRGKAHSSPAEQAERNAAWRVAAARKAWRKRHGKARVPGDAIAAMVREAREEAARAFGVAIEKISAANIRSAQKAGRFVVP